MSVFAQQLEKIRQQPGFIAALDQSGGSTPKALKLYGIDEHAYADDDEMFAQVHAMRERIVTSKAFNGQRVLGAILFENTLDREFQGQNPARYLWEHKQVVPFLKVDQGLAEEDHGVQLMKPIVRLDALLAKAKQRGIFGTKMRSVIKRADADGVAAITAQQLELGKQICAAGLVPIIEPEIDIHSTSKAAAEQLLLTSLLAELDQLAEDQQVMLKLTLPEQANFYRDAIAHPRVLRVVALSGGYNCDEANRRLAQNEHMIASFSRALTEALNAQQSDDEFDRALDTAIESIYRASST